MQKLLFCELWVRHPPNIPVIPPVTAVTRSSYPAVTMTTRPGAPLPWLILACLAFSSPHIHGGQSRLQDFLAQNILLLQATQYLLFRHDFSMLHCSFAFQVCLSREIGENTVRFPDELETFWKKTQKNTLKKYIEYSYLANPGVIYWFSSTYWINSRTPVTWSSRLTPFQEPLSRNLEKHGFYK